MAVDSSRRLRVLFRVAAGPRLGFGHLVRATVLARAMGVEMVVSLRGSAEARRTAKRLGCRVVPGPARALLPTMRPDILVIDDPSGRAAAAWCRSGRSEGVPVASVHDLGIAYCGADLTIDGSVTLAGGRPDGPALLGPRYAILGPRSERVARRSRAVLVALGGGPRAGVALALARAIRSACPDVAVRVAAGYAPTRPRPVVAGVTWLGPQRGLGRELARASVAVVAGGCTLYEALRDGTPTVAVSVVPAQRPTIRACASAGAALDGGPAAASAAVRRLVARLLDDAGLRRQIGATGRSLIDGRGAARVARAVATLARTSHRNRPGARA